MRVFSYCLLIFLLGTGCRGIRNLLLDKGANDDIDRRMTLVIAGDYQKTSEV